MVEVMARCSICGRKENYTFSEEDSVKFIQYQVLGRDMGKLQDIFPNVPAWIRSCCIDQMSGGFAICPGCAG